MGWPLAEAVGRPLEDVFHIINGATREPSENPMALAVRQNRTVNLTANCILIRRDGRESPIEDSAAPIHDRHGRTTGAVIVFHDVSAARQMSVQMAHLAQHDFLTDLPNRLLLRDRLQQAIASARRHGGQVAVLFLDLDRFKEVNDSLGHSVGDRLLQEVAARLLRSVRRSDTVGRLGGDEFVVVLPELADARERRHQRGETAVGAGCALYHRFRPTARTRQSSASASTRTMRRMRTRCWATPTPRCITQSRMAAIPTGSSSATWWSARRSGSSLKPPCASRSSAISSRCSISRNSASSRGPWSVSRRGCDWRHPDRGVIPPAQFVPIAESTGLTPSHRTMGAARSVQTVARVARRRIGAGAVVREHLGHRVREPGLRQERPDDFERNRSVSRLSGARAQRTSA